MPIDTSTSAPSDADGPAANELSLQPDGRGAYCTHPLRRGRREGDAVERMVTPVKLNPKLSRPVIE